MVIKDTAQDKKEKGGCKKGTNFKEKVYTYSYTCCLYAVSDFSTKNLNKQSTMSRSDSQQWCPLFMEAADWLLVELPQKHEYYNHGIYIIYTDYL